MFAGRAERNRARDSVSVIILRCWMRGVSQLFLETIAVMDGARVIVARSGTACRAPTEETATAKRTVSCSAPNINDPAALLRRRRLKPTLLRQGADPDALGGWFAEVDAGWAMAGDGEGHGLIVFALMDAEAGAGSQAEVH